MGELPYSSKLDVNVKVNYSHLNGSALFSVTQLDVLKENESI